ncbi:MAG: hypothetical protein H6741_18180 [Alphaproteobacteria bacterium]|nr:hypothetical protein [Alphaproteobacteria bacterium]
MIPDFNIHGVLPPLGVRRWPRPKRLITSFTSLAQFWALSRLTAGPTFVVKVSP